VAAIRTGRTRAGLVDRLDPVICDLQKMVLLEHPLARLRVDEVQPRPEV
jgi:hypothetical protein